MKSEYFPPQLSGDWALAEPLFRWPKKLARPAAVAAVLAAMVLGAECGGDFRRGRRLPGDSSSCSVSPL